MNVYLLIALIGSVTGTVSLAIQLFKYLGERPKIQLVPGASRERGLTKLLVNVINTGKETTTIQRVGVIKEKDKGYFRGEFKKKRYAMYSLKPVGQFLIGPGVSVECSLVINYKGQKFFVMDSLIPFAIDYQGKIIKGKPFSFADFFKRYIKL